MGMPGEGSRRHPLRLRNGERRTGCCRCKVSRTKRCPRLTAAVRVEDGPKRIRIQNAGTVDCWIRMDETRTVVPCRNSPEGRTGLRMLAGTPEPNGRVDHRRTSGALSKIKDVMECHS